MTIGDKGKLLHDHHHPHLRTNNCQHSVNLNIGLQEQLQPPMTTQPAVRCRLQVLWWSARKQHDTRSEQR